MTESPWRSATDRETDREEKRLAVLRTAARAFSEHGFHETSLDDVAMRLNITKPTVYRYVKNKDDILYQCLVMGLENIEEALLPLSRSNISGLEKLRTMMRVHVKAATEDVGRCIVLVGEDPLPPKTRDKLRQVKRAIDDHMRRAIAQGIKDGTIRRINPKIAAFTIAGALNWVARWYQPDGEFAPEEIADQITDLLANGIANRRT